MGNEEFLEMIDRIDWLSGAQSIDKVLNAEYPWDWLPTGKNDVSPFSVEFGEDSWERFGDIVLSSYKRGLVSLRKVKHKRLLLVSGPHDFSESFKGAALFCIRNAAIENASGKDGKWLEILTLYEKGRWPCGVKENGQLVIL